MTLHTLEVATWKLSAAISLIRLTADSDDHVFDSAELYGLCEILNEVKTAINPTTGGITQ